MLTKHYFPYVEAAGSPGDIGRAHGTAGRERIVNSIDTYKAMFMDYAQLSWESVKQKARDYIPYIDKFDPEIMEEIDGIAVGSGKTVEEILALNIRSEIVMQEKYRMAASEGCTSLAVSKDISDDGCTWIAQNWDWKLSQRAAVIHLNMKQRNKPDISILTEAGIVGKIGINSSGLGICFNALAADKAVMGVPVHVLLRGALNCDRLDQVIGMVGNHPSACSGNFLMASATGDLIDIEIGPGDYEVLLPERNGYISHANHFTSHNMTGFKDAGKWSFPDSLLRHYRMDQLMAEKENPGYADICEVLSDHRSYPSSICRHDDMAAPEGLRTGTVFAIVMNLDRRELYVAPGEPCCTPFERVL